MGSSEGLNSPTFSSLMREMMNDPLHIMGKFHIPAKLPCGLCGANLDGGSYGERMDKGCCSPVDCCYASQTLEEAGWTKDKEGRWKRP